MTTSIEDTIHIMLVNDLMADLEHLNDEISENCSDRIVVHLYGPEQAGSRQVARQLLKSLSNPSLDSALPVRVDVMFVDYQMPDINGIAFVKLLKNINKKGTKANGLRTPVVLMTKYESSLLEKLNSEDETGISGYVFTNRDFLWLDVEATAKRVFQESQRERWAEALMDISSQIPSVTGRYSLCDLIARVLAERCPNIKLFIRQYDPRADNLTLIGSSHNVPDYYKKHLHVLASDRFPMLRDAIAGGIMFYNSLDELSKSPIHEEDLETCRVLQLDRGMSFPLRDSMGNIFGTICMYRRSIDPPFTYLERNYAELMSKQVAETWTSRKERKQGIAYARFLTDFTRCENEDGLFRDLVAHLHKEINGKAEKASTSKITFKALAPGSDKLVCNNAKGHHLGVPRESDFCPSVFSKKSISAWVARENKPRIINDYREEHDYSSTNKAMTSELCLPVAGTPGDSEPMIGVVNLECSERAFYTEEDLEYAETLCRLSGHFVDRLRIRAFLSRVLQTLGEKGSREELVKRSIGLIRELTGYRLLLFIVRDTNAGKWRITNLDVSSGKTTGQEIAAYVEETLNSAKGRTLLETALSQNKDIYYEPNVLSRPKHSYFVPPGLLAEDEKLGSQAVFMMRAGEFIVGALSLDFVITNALSPSQRELLGYFACWLGKLIMQDDSLKDLSRRIELLEGLQSFTDMLSRIWHSSEGQLYSLRNLCEACLHDQNVTDKTELHDNLSKLQIGIEQISGMPSRIAALARVPVAENVNTGTIWREIVNDLSAKAKHMKVLVEKEGEPNHVWADKDILWMILYHLLDNALDACKDQPERKVSLRSRKLSDSRVELCVADSGRGIAPSEIDHVTDLGYTTKGHGIGYGLFWVKQRVLDMQGEFHLISAGINMGASAIIVLDAPKF